MLSNSPALTRLESRAARGPVLYLGKSFLFIVGISSFGPSFLLYRARFRRFYEPIFYGSINLFRHYGRSVVLVAKNRSSEPFSENDGEPRVIIVFGRSIR